ncbi:MAG: hypothetical protein K8H88_00805 [Sandaracinaceae bacterium]|nr:hypothetical protein [Sandaracinaceae bacterium]
MKSSTFSMKPIAIVLVLTTFLALGCGGRRRQFVPVIGVGQTATTGGGQTVSTGAVRASGTPLQQLEQLDGVLRGQGFAPLGVAVHGNLQPNGMIAYAVDAQPGSCYTLITMGEDPSQNIDMIVLDPIGRTSAHDVRSDAHPWASFCSATAGRFIARVQMTAGQGGYYYAAYVGPPGRQMELSQFFGQSAQPSVQVAQMDPETQQRLGVLDQQLGAQGFQRSSQPVGLQLGTAQPRDFQLSLVQGACYAFAALGGQGAVDTDVRLTDASGSQLAIDTNQQRDALIQYCAPATGNYVLQVRMHRGQGALFAAAYVQGAQQQATPVMAATSTAGAGLEENVALLDADMRARGYESYGERTTQQLDEGGTRGFEVDLEGNKCYAILAVGDASVRNLDLRLLDARGAEVDRDDGPDARPTVRVCPRTSGHYTMQVRMTQGSGAFVYAPYRWPRGIRGPFGLEGLIYLRLAEVTALLSVEQYQPDPGFTPQNGRLARQGAQATQQVDLASGQCYAAVVVGGDGVTDLDVTLSFGGQTLASDGGSRSAFPSVRHCAQQDGRYTVTITAAAGQGAFHMQVFNRPPGE